MAPADLHQRVERHVRNEGTVRTPIEGLELFRVNRPLERLPTVYSPSLC
ncbi:MAG: hypothetical protein AAFX94_16795 [Myxococcota bacterium]